MSNVTATSANAWLTQATALQGNGSSQGSSSAMDAFSSLFAQILAMQGQAQSADLTSATGPTSGQNATAGVQGLSGGAQSTVNSDLNTLGQALASGNVAAAQQAFQSLQTDLQGAQQTHHHHHHHHLAGGSSEGSQDATAQAGTTQATGSTSLAQNLLGGSGRTTVDTAYLGLYLG
ncbi:MAG: hypothetical protein ABSH53_17075 [Holophaga sp.]|jgi:hypothetical protein